MANLTITPTQVLPGDDAVTTRGIAGATILEGDAAYYDSEAKLWYPAIAISTSGAADVEGLALNSAGPKQTVTVQTDGTITLGAGAAPVVGTVYVLSGTAGKIAPAVDLQTTWYRTVIGCGDLVNTLVLGIFASDVLPGGVLNQSLMKTVIASTQVADTTPQVGAIIDILGYAERTFYFLIGTVADVDATFTVLLEDGDVANLSDAAAVADAFMVSQTLAVAPETAASWNFGDDNEVRKLGYIGTKRYLRLTVTPALNTGLADFAVYAVLGAGLSVPITQTPS